jgi:methylaspartate ammonia-lyase
VNGTCSALNCEAGSPLKLLHNSNFTIHHSLFIMSHLPTITNALVLPGASADPNYQSLLAGLIIDGRRIGWGECRLQPGGSEHGSLLDENIHLLEELIIPALIGRPLENVVALMAGIDEIRQRVTISRAITAESPPQKRTRRELFTGLINPEQELREVVERPLPPELRFGVSQALFSAAATVEEQTIVETIARLYSVNPAKAALPIHLVFDDLPNANDPALERISAASYGLRIQEGQPLKELGQDGIRFQNRVRQLKNRVVHAADRFPNPYRKEPGFLFDLKGGFGRLYENNMGAILGTIFGLEQTVKPSMLRLVDPFILEERQSQIDIMRELAGLLRARKMKSRLIAGAWVETAADIYALADDGCCDGVLLDMTRLGTLHRTIELAQAARERGLEVILAGARGEAAVHTALALNPTLLAVGVGEAAAVSNEIGRTLAWLEYKINY